MNHVGVEGKGESVWMAWFLGTVLISFGDVTHRYGATFDDASSRVETWRARADALARAAEASAWDGEWYLRAFFDNEFHLSARTSTPKLASILCRNPGR